MNKHERAHLANRTCATAGAIAFAYKELENRLGPQLQHLTTSQRAAMLSEMATEAVRMASAPTPQVQPALHGDGR